MRDTKGVKNLLSALEKGHKLEEKIEKYFQLNGYKTKRNFIVEGNSGSKHEIDVFAEKSDAVTSIKIMVECKAWDKPIEKDVVSKAHYVLNDSGANKAIIVSLRGFRVGAKAAAEKLGIELWGREEIKNRLGAVEISKLEAAPFEKLTLGINVKLTKEQAMTEIEANREKRFGAEEHIFTKLVYVPLYLIEFTYAVHKGTIRRKEVVKTKQALCDAIEGSYYPLFDPSQYTMSLHLKEISITAPVITAKIKSAKLRKKVEKAVKEYDKYVTASAKKRRMMKIKGVLGPIKSANLTIDTITEMYYPFYAGMLQKEERSRWVVVDGVKGEISKEMSGVFNHNSSYVQEQMK